MENNNNKREKSINRQTNAHIFSLAHKTVNMMMMKEKKMRIICIEKNAHTATIIWKSFRMRSYYTLWTAYIILWRNIDTLAHCPQRNKAFVMCYCANVSMPIYYTIAHRWVLFIISKHKNTHNFLSPHFSQEIRFYVQTENKWNCHQVLFEK